MVPSYEDPGESDPEPDLSQAIILSQRKGQMAETPRDHYAENHINGQKEIYFFVVCCTACAVTALGLRGLDSGHSTAHANFGNKKAREMGVIRLNGVVGS